METAENKFQYLSCSLGHKTKLKPVSVSRSRISVEIGGQHPVHLTREHREQAEDKLEGR